MTERSEGMAVPLERRVGPAELLEMIQERAAEIAYLCDYARQGRGDTDQYLLRWAKHHAAEATSFASTALLVTPNASLTGGYAAPAENPDGKR